MKVLIIIPAYNEELNICKEINEITQKAPEYDYLIVNDCSNDSTEAVCIENNYNYISFPANLGIGGAVQAGYRYALRKGYDIVIQQDGDGQHDPGFISQVIKPIVEGECDITIGSRFIENEGFQSSWTRRLGIKFLSKLIKICSGARVLDVTSGYRAVNRKYVEFYAKRYAQDYPEPEAIVTASLDGAKIKEVPVTMRERENGTSSINFKRSIYYMIKVSTAIIIQRLSCVKGVK